MKGIIYYHSSTGNTLLACRYLTSKIASIDWQLIDMTNGGSEDLSKFDVTGIAFPTFHLGIAPLVKSFLEKLSMHNKKPVFLLNTYGMMQGKALKLAADILSKKGFTLLDYLALMLPENYPPFILKGWGNANQPDDKQLLGLNNFIDRLSEKLESIEIKKASILPADVKLDFFNRVLGVKSEKKIQREMKGLTVIEDKCSHCGECERHCHYGAISFSDRPRIIKESCKGCYSCFNHCPQNAIVTLKVQTNAQYKGPSEELVKRLSVS